jgi:hypothetical protein
MAMLSKIAPSATQPDTIPGLAAVLSKIPPPAPQPDTILGRTIYGEGINPHTEIDPIELQPPDIVDRIRRNKNRYEWGPKGQSQGWGSLAEGPPDIWHKV